MKRLPEIRRFRPPAAASAALALALLAAALPAGADDRDLLRSSSGRPYVFILFDTSGSMHWTPQCTQAQFDAGECDFLCPTGDCYAPRNGDDPASKFYQAKEALYEVLDSIEDIDFGFASFNQDQLRLRAKHWLYQAVADGPTFSGSLKYPLSGAEEVFGLQWNCDSGGNSGNIGCASNAPADLDDPWEVARVQRLPKGGVSFNTDRLFFIRTGGVVYRVTYHPESGTLGDSTVEVEVTIERCNNSSCDNRTQVGQRDVTFRRIGDFNAWDAGVDRNARQQGFFSQAEGADSPAGGSCEGWDPNDDPLADPFVGYNLRWSTTVHPTPAFRPHLDRGDVLPLTWETDNKQAILDRLAPNRLLGETTPDFSTARYFRDTPEAAGYTQLRGSGVARPLIAFGATPLGDSIKDFRTWYAGCPQGNCPHDSGWRDLAAAHDPEWGCRRKFLLVITDGDETCGGGNSACNGTAALRAQEAIRTFVVAFGVQGGGNTLTCMAANGGTGDPVFPQNKQQLVDALLAIFGEISEEAASFASAAVPSVQAEVSDKIYLTNFTPLNATSVWDGHVDAYLKPLPLHPDTRLPDKTRVCDGSRRSECYLWDAAQRMLAQAPTEDDVNSDIFRLSDAATDRRVYYPLAAVGSGAPRSKRLFTPPPNQPLWLDLLTGMGIAFDVTDLTPAQDRATDAIRYVLRQKVDTIDDAGGGTEITYILGDVFHSNPEAVSTPNRFRYFTADLYGDGSDCTAEPGGNPGYRCFFVRHRYRRKMLLAGTNDAQLHAFEAGQLHVVELDDAGEIAEADYDNGTGRELFSIIPRPLLPHTVHQAERSRHEWGVDGTVLVDDFFIDPVHNGTPDPDQREWRTLAISGLREGGSAYLAVDITQPDRYTTQGSSIVPDHALPVASLPTDPDFEYDVPSCLDDYDAAECGPLRFPSVLWEFTGGALADEDLNGQRDLGDTWSIPNTGRLRVIENGEPVDKFVAVFGGGMDPAKAESAGDWLFIVDVETGQEIYKRQLIGSAPSEPAAVDLDQNGYLDTIYIGTTAGLLYKVDIGTPAPIVDLTVLGTTVQRITAEAWDPFPIVDTGGRPIYFPPAVVFVSKLGRYALGFGTGDREDLWDQTGQTGRFFMIVDEGFGRLDAGLPVTESEYGSVAAVGGEEAGRNFLLNPEVGRRPGWVMSLDGDERVITKTFSLSGVTVFTSYMPEIQITGGGGGGGGGGPGGNPGDVPICSKTGQSRIFVVFTDSANAILTLEGQKTRYWLVPEFVTDPFVERSATKNPTDQSGGADADELTDELREVMETLKGLFPDDCRFGNFTLNLKTVRSDTGVNFIAPIPVCIIEKNWKEF